jgi:carbon-monoxide dehydrogenase large subunit
MGVYAMGQPVTRAEDARLLRGEGRYAGDVVLPGMAHATIVRSPHAHARVGAIDIAAAAAAPGVIAVLTGADYMADRWPSIPCGVAFKGPDGNTAFQTPRPVLETARVRHVGEPVAVVVAETQAAADDAAELVSVDYEPLAAVVDTALATGPGQPRVWDEVPDNLSVVWRAGDAAAVDAAMAKAAHVTRLDFVITRVSANSLEPRIAVGEYDAGDESYTLHVSHQGPYGLRTLLAGMLKLPESRIRVIVRDVGGSFGMKSGVHPEEVLTLWAARRVGRPVRWVSGRAEAHLSDDHARDNVSRAELALDRDGRFLALRVLQTVNMGPYLSSRAIASTNNVGGLTGVYTTPVIHAELRGILTNTAPTAPYRGAGRPEATYAVERVIDEAARELGIDPVELRRRNLIPASAMPYKTGFIFTYDSGDFAANVDKAVEVGDRAGFAQRREASKARGRLRGLGLSNPIEVAGGPYGRRVMDRAAVRFEPDGSVMVTMGAMSTGQGLETAMMQLVSARLGVPFERIRVQQGDTAGLDFGKGSGGSGGLCVGGSAVNLAVERVIERAKKVAAHMLEAAEADVAFSDGHFSVAGTDRRVAIEMVARTAAQSALLPPSIEPGLSETATFTPPTVTFPNGCHLCEVEIDPETGEVEVVRYTVAEDVGRVLNPLLLEGQIHGGVAQGLGQALFEEIVYDRESGQLVTGSFMDYAMPRAADLPMIAFASNVVPTEVNPLGAKGAGEAGTVGALSAVMNAVVDALAPLGVTKFDMPATPERVWRAIEAARRG